jgi:hypothetical protein
VGGRGVDDVLPDQAGADSGSAVFGVDDALREPGGVDEQNVIAERYRAVAGSLNGDAELVLCRELHSRGNVLGAVHCHHGARVDWHRNIPRSRQLVASLTRQRDRSGHLGA